MDDRRLVLRPDPVTAAGWAVGAVALVAIGGWLAWESRGPSGWLAIAVAVAVGSYFVLQLVAPALFEVVCDEVGIRGRNLNHVVEVAWEHVHIARVSRVAGDPILRLAVRDTYDSYAAALLLPLGADLDALHDCLAAHLGGPAEGGTA